VLSWRKNPKRGLLSGKETADLPSPFFRVDEIIPETGVYRVFHAEHRVSHSATLLGGDKFPRCSKCGHNVHYELLVSAPQVELDEDFCSRKIFELPHPEEPEKSARHRTAKIA
jgi:hypothetical protein